VTATVTTLRRARVPAGAPRTGLQRWLAELDPQHHGLPPEAIVVVRRLSARLAALEGAGADPFAIALRQAVRPAREHFVGAGVGAVWFADEAELLACLARDALGGVLGQPWWWPLLFGRAPAVPLVLARWVAEARAVPHALALLQAEGLGDAWLASLGAAGRSELLQGLARAWPLCAAMRRYVEDGSVPEGGSSFARLGPQAATMADAWTGARPGVTREDAPQRLLRLAALLRQAPHRAADPAVVAEWAALPAGEARPEGDATPDAEPRPVPTTGDIARAVTRQTAKTPPAAQASTPLPASLPRAAPMAEPHAARQARQPDQGAVSPLAAEPRVHRLAASAPVSTNVAGARPVAHARCPALVADVGAVANFDTPHGGLAFLVNVALALGLYGDFTQPQHRGQPLSPWWLLHEAGRAVCGRAWRADPLAAWLRARAGAPSRAVTLPWQLPASALAPFAADARPWHAVRSPQALVLRHPAGFVVAYHEPGDEVHGLLQALQRPAQPVSLHAAPLAQRSQPLAVLLWPLLRARLAQGLGLPMRAALGTLALPARVRARGERLDLHFSLAALPLCVRLAGLDRDPGWVPAAGCDIRFHFD